MYKTFAYLSHTCMLHSTMIELKHECRVLCKNNMTSHKKKNEKRNKLKKIAICCSKHGRAKSTNSKFWCKFWTQCKANCYTKPLGKMVDGAIGQ
jgi:hypothetical protein